MASNFLFRFLPKQPSDRIAFCFLIIVTHVVCLFEVFVILPYIDNERSKTFWFHIVLGTAIYVNICAAFYRLFTIDSTVHSVTLPTLLHPGYFYCSACGVNAPPRSFHCYSCEVCVLRRDHHCIFSGNCVGHANQRYFLTLLIYLTLGAMYCNYLNTDYALEILGGFSFRAVLTILLPMLSWSVGLAGAETFAISFVSSLCLVGFGLFAVMLGYHVRNLVRCQTCNERNSGVRDYDCGWKSNLETVFGKKWYVSWMSAFVASEPCGNGTEFRKKYQYENIKDM